MKKILGVLSLTLTILTLSTNSAQAGETGEAIGGFAVVNPETGIVHGVITGSIEYFGGNNRTMGSEYMGCPAGCLIVQQSTADQNSNVAGVRTQQNGNEIVTYNQERNVFQVIESNTTQSEVVIESSSTNSAVETNINVSRSVRVYEFGVQDFTNNNAVFEMTEIAPPQNTSVEIFAKTTEFVCEESNLLCSSTRSNSSNILVDESVSFNERSTAVQVETKIIVEAKNKIREQLSLILSMLEKWIIN
jgi:hypothetical protein